MNIEADISYEPDVRYTSSQSRKNTIAVLGSSKTTDGIVNYIEACTEMVERLILNGKNIVHGCGSLGIMGAAYKAAQTYSKTDDNGRLVQNLAIITIPLWGNEDLDNCLIIAKAKSEADRIEKFGRVADSFIIFPGSAGTLQEAATLVAQNYYGKSENKKEIILVGKEFFRGLWEQYNQLYAMKLISCQPEELFELIDVEEAKNLIFSKGAYK